MAIVSVHVPRRVAETQQVARQPQGITGGAILPLPRGPAPAAAATVGGAAAAGPAIRPETWYVVLAGVLIVGGVLIGRILTGVLNPPAFVPVAGVSVFAVLYIFAQALERIAEFGTYIFPGTGATTTPDGTKTKEDAVKERDTAFVATLNAAAQGHADTQVQASATTQATVDQVRANRALTLWAVNACLASIGCGLLGLYLLRMVGMSTVPLWLDIGLTGLVVGGGTKPLHDLITNIQKAKESKEDPSQTRTTS